MAMIVVVVVAVAAVTLGGAMYLNRPLESQRPSNPSTDLEASQYPQFPRARLWQDPLHVVHEHWDTVNDSQRKAVPFVTNIRDVIARSEGPDPGADGDRRVLRLLVMLSGMPYSDDREQRRRQRHAVVSALTGAGFVPNDGTRLQYFHAPPFRGPRRAGRFVRAGAGVSTTRDQRRRSLTFDEYFTQNILEAEAGGSSNEAEAGGSSNEAEAGGSSNEAETGDPSNDPTLVGYETYEPDVEPGWGSWPSVEVFWLNTEDFLQHPLHKVSALVAALDHSGRPNSGEATTVLLGPPSSGVLQAMFNEIAGRLSPRPKVLFLNYPHNPTGHCVEPEFFREVVAIARRHELIVVHDFAYGQVCFDGYRAPSFLSTPGAMEVGVEFTTMSKTFNMAGWRIGYCAGNPTVVGALGAIKGYYDYGIFQAIQIASIIGLRECDNFAHEQAARYQERRDTLVDGLRRIGWTDLNAPRAGMFVWAPLPERFRALGSMEFARRLMDDAEVAVSPGRGFGPEGEGCVRLALIENRQRLLQAVRQMKRAFQKWPDP